MTVQQQYANLISEYRYVEQMIAECPKNAVISRFSLQSRLKAIQQEIEELQYDSHASNPDL